MKLELRRLFSNEEVTIGLLRIDGVARCWTLEDAQQKVKIPGRTRIPAGTYELGLRASAKYMAIYGHPMLHILNIPNFTMVYFHPGNTAEDTAGCILVGAGVILDAAFRLGNRPSC